MRTTIDLPDDLFRRAKATAALRGIKLKDLIGRFIEVGLRDEAVERNLPPRSKRSPIPVIAKATGPPIPALSKAEIAEIEMEEDLEKLRRSFGR